MSKKGNSYTFKLNKDLVNEHAGRERHLKLREDTEVKKHSGLVINMDITVQQEAYQGAEIEDWLKGAL